LNKVKSWVNIVFGVYIRVRLMNKLSHLLLNTISEKDWKLCW